MPPKREGSGSRQPGNQQFSFVTFQHPSGAKDDNARREVRSHVTTLQHRLSRQKRHAAREEAYQELQRRNQGLGQPILPHPAPRAPEEEVTKEDSSAALQGTSQSGPMQPNLVDHRDNMASQSSTLWTHPRKPVNREQHLQVHTRRQPSHPRDLLARIFQQRLHNTI